MGDPAMKVMMRRRISEIKMTAMVMVIYENEDENESGHG